MNHRINKLIRLDYADAARRTLCDDESPCFCLNLDVSLVYYIHWVLQEAADNYEYTMINSRLLDWRHTGNGCYDDYFVFQDDDMLIKKLEGMLNPYTGTYES